MILDRILNVGKHPKYTVIHGHVMLFSQWAPSMWDSIGQKLKKPKRYKLTQPVLRFNGPALVILRKNTRRHPRRVRYVAFFDLRRRA